MNIVNQNNEIAIYGKVIWNTNILLSEKIDTE